MYTKTLLIFVKNPVLGKVKTRLARTLGDEKALQVYHFLLRHTAELVGQLSSVRKMVYYSHFVPTEVDKWGFDPFEKRQQQGIDLGERMKNAFEHAFELQQANRVGIIGSDCGELTPSILEEAFDKLDTYDFVLGPAHDGGYYFLGMREHPHPEVFENIVWSTDTVLADTLAIIQRMQKTYYLLPALSDIDTEADWLAFLSKQGA